MKVFSKLLIGIGVMIYGGLLNPNHSFGFVNPNSVASVSSLEMWHLSKENGVVKWTPKVSDVIPDTKSVSTQDLFSLQLSCHIIDTRISLLLSDRGISTKTLVVVDVDPGTDDAVALYLCKLLQLAPTHFVATMGNRSLENTLCNLLILRICSV